MPTKFDYYHKSAIVNSFIGNLKVSTWWTLQFFFFNCLVYCISFTQMYGTFWDLTQIVLNSQFLSQVKPSANWSLSHLSASCFDVTESLADLLEQIFHFAFQILTTLRWNTLRFQLVTPYALFTGCCSAFKHIWMERRSWWVCDWFGLHPNVHSIHPK